MKRKSIRERIKNYFSSLDFSSILFSVLLSLILTSIIFFGSIYISNNMPTYNGNSIDIIYFSSNFLGLFNNRILTENEEFTYCMNGTRLPGDNAIYIDKIIPTKIYEKNQRFIEHQRCQSILQIHSHPLPNGACMLSEEDEDMIRKSKILYSCVICNEDKIRCFDREFNDVLIGNKGIIQNSI